MTQYIVKTNLNHHYNKLQNAKARIDNSLPDSMLKSQKVRDRKKQENRPHSSKSSRCAKNHQTSRSHSQLSNYGNLEENFMDKYGDDLEAEVERIVQMTLNGRSQDLQGSLYTQSTKDYNRQTNATSEDTLRSTSRCRKMSSMSQTSFAAPSFVSNSEKQGTGRRPGSSTRREEQDLLHTRAHLFTEPDKPFVPKILKSNRTSLLNQYKYYNPPKKIKPKQHPGDLNQPKLSSDVRESGKGEAPVPKPRQKANPGDTPTLSSKTHYLNEECKKVPPLEIPADEDQKESLSEQITSLKRSPPVSSTGHVKLLHSQSAMDLPKGLGGLNKSESLTTHGSESRDKEYGLNHMVTPKNQRKKKHVNLNSERSSRSILETKWEEADYTSFMKEVTEEILMKGLYTNRSIQRVFESHMRKRKGQLNEGEMKKMLSKLQNDIGISRSDLKESTRPTLQSSSASSVKVDSSSVQMNQNGKEPDQDRDLLSTVMLKEYEEKLIQDENSHVTSEVYSSEIDLHAYKDYQKQKVKEFEAKNMNDNSKNPEKSCGDVEEKKMKVSESEGTGARRPVPRPRQKNSTINLASSIPANLPSFPDNVKVKSDSKGEYLTGNNNQNGIEPQNSEICPISNGQVAERHPKVGTSSSFEDASGFDSKQNVMEKTSVKSETLAKPEANRKGQPSSQVKKSEEVDYDDDFEDDDDDIYDSDSDF